MWRVAFALFACTGCDAVLHFERVSGPEAALAGYTYRKPITITQTTGATLADFPVAIVIDDPDLAAHAASDGSDLVFADGTNLLACEISDYGGGTLVAWVRVAELPPGPTTIDLYYGGPARTGDPGDTWSDSYRGVWHEEHSDTSERDSTHDRLDVSAATVTPGSMQGVAGLGRAYAGVAGQQMCVADGAGLLSFDVSSMSYSMWVRIAVGASIKLGEPLHKGGSSAGGAGFDFEFTSSWEAGISDMLATETVVLTTAPRTSRWEQIAGVVDREAGMFFRTARTRSWAGSTRSGSTLPRCRRSGSGSSMTT